MYEWIDNKKTNCCDVRAHVVYFSHFVQMQSSRNITISPDVSRPAPARGWLALIGSVIDKIGKLEDWEIAWTRLTDTAAGQRASCDVRCHEAS